MPLSSNKAIAERMLADLLERIEKARVGDPEIRASNRPAQEHLQDYLRHLMSKNRSEKHLIDIARKLDLYFETMQIELISQIDCTTVENLVIYLRAKRNNSLQTCNHYLKKIKSFCHWLVREGRLQRNPIAAFACFNAEVDRRHLRRSLSYDEFGYLLKAAVKNKTVQCLSGYDRGMLYTMAYWTGLRKSELGSLRLENFQVNTEIPTVTVEAQYSKRRQNDTLVLHANIVDVFKRWIESKRPRKDEPLFPISKHHGGIERKTSKMIEYDLSIARQCWIDEAESEIEKISRAQSDFLRHVDTQGRHVDFHSLRHAFITNLIHLRIPLKTLQVLARHSDIRMTIEVYGHVSFFEQVEAIRLLPSIPIDL